MVAPSDEPATAMAAPISAEPLADVDAVVAAATAWGRVLAADDGPDVSAIATRTRAPSRRIPFTASRIRSAGRPRRRSAQLVASPTAMIAGSEIIQITIRPPLLRAERARAGTADPHRRKSERTARSTPAAAPGCPRPGPPARTSGC